MDFINLGAIGFAQMGSDDYTDKRNIEKQVLRKYFENDIFNIPEEFVEMCSIGIKRFSYEYSSYDEVVLFFDPKEVDEWEAIDEGEEESRYDRFWKFVNSLESIDFESEELMNKCRIEYAESIKLSVSHRKEPGTDEEMKAV